MDAGWFLFWVVIVVLIIILIVNGFRAANLKEGKTIVKNVETKSAGTFFNFDIESKESKKNAQKAYQHDIAIFLEKEGDEDDRDSWRVKIVDMYGNFLGYVPESERTNIYRMVDFDHRGTVCDVSSKHGYTSCMLKLVVHFPKDAPIKIVK